MRARTHTQPDPFHVPFYGTDAVRGRMLTCVCENRQPASIKQVDGWRLGPGSAELPGPELDPVLEPSRAA